jgi:prevent-host-death family protein
MKTMTAREAKNHFGEFLDAAQREPVIITKNNRPVGLMISIEDAADTILPEFLTDKDPDYEDWLTKKVGGTLSRVIQGDAGLHEHDKAMDVLRQRLTARFNKTAA